MVQTNLIDQLERQTDKAVTLAGTHANPQWLQEAEATVSILCKQGQDFVSDDVWRILDQTGVTTHEPRALGAVIRKFAKEGLIYPTGAYRKSLRKDCHRRPLAVWRPIGYKRNLREAE